ncbi:MAG: hypothetical protein PHX07_02855, partial [Candidatus Marinimicrobia bacterium]|nr:hypothetical protein [Candidatus Neomarinimicrobiota bacterium]
MKFCGVPLLLTLLMLNTACFSGTQETVAEQARSEDPVPIYEYTAEDSSNITSEILLIPENVEFET